MKLFDNFKISVLSWLLHYGNQNGKDQYFYKVKNRLLAKYGKHICYEVQFIEGKKCRSCDGTGIYKGYNWQYGWFRNPCYNCYNGWYKRPEWNILALISFGKYEFHQPFMRVYDDPQSKCKTFDGYVERHPTNLSRIAAFILLLVFEKGYLKRFYRESGNGWRLYWWLPRNWVNNIIYLIKHGRKSYPFHHKGVLRQRIERRFFPKPKPVFYPSINDEDELPF
jgi:hypothetical protein